MCYPSKDLADYATETEASASLGIRAGEGNVWRHLRLCAPGVTIYDIGGVKAVYRPDLDAYVAQRAAEKAQRAEERRHREAEKHRRVMRRTVRRMLRRHNSSLGEAL